MGIVARAKNLKLANQKPKLSYLHPVSLSVELIPTPYFDRRDFCRTDAFTVNLKYNLSKLRIPAR